MQPDEPTLRRRVVVTGLGAISPVGLDTASMWEALVAGQSGVDYITAFDTKTFDTKIAAEVKGFDPEKYVSRKLAQRMDRFTQFAVGASLQAKETARLVIDEGNSMDCGVIIGNSVCGLLSISAQYKVLMEQGPRRVSPILAPTMTGDAASVQVSLILGAKGVNYAPSSACSSGCDAIGQAYDQIRLGNARIMVAGGTEAPIMPIVIAAFSNIRALSAKNENPQEACRPFDARRNGFVMAEGAGIMVLEDAEYARERGAPILAELAGYGATSDAFHLTQPAPDGASAAAAVRMALERGNVSPEEIDYINAHGTATLLNDRMETNVIKSVFGERARQIPISASKSMIGHLLGAAGGIEAVITVLAMQHGVAPPTINLTVPDPECDLDYVPNHSRKVRIDTAVSNSFGFGGHNSVLVFRKFKP
ncbi:MAG: beta-ketoacyl-[acyl-carrier-protein] synthase II [Chloroflexi bacterium RBG_16_56_11]|nr:MAG: beta-ketoacyl-[acyl-carrier-protein] synthase II [Chloroflexi bacterium RBG_16_56_11]